MIRAAGLALGLAAWPAAAAGQDAIEAPGRLADEDFYRLVACAAPPGGACSAPVLRWETGRPIRVTLSEIAPAFTGRRKPRAEAAVTRAIQALNAAGAGFRLARVAAGQPAEIDIRFVDVASARAFAGLAGGDAGPTATRLEVEPDSGLIRRAALVVTTTLKTEDFEARLLADLTRAMGLATAVGGPAYAGRSVLAETGPGPKSLAAQDIAALKRHYAPAPR